MLKVVIPVFLLLVSAVPMVADSKDVYPVSCSDLWVAVKGALDHPGDYSVLVEDETLMRAAFVVVGERVQYTEKVALVDKGTACALKANITEVGADNLNWRHFHKLLDKALAKLKAAKPAAAPAATPAATPAQSMP